MIAKCCKTVCSVCTRAGQLTHSQQGAKVDHNHKFAPHRPVGFMLRKKQHHPIDRGVKEIISMWELCQDFRAIRDFTNLVHLILDEERQGPKRSDNLP